MVMSCYRVFLRDDGLRYEGQWTTDQSPANSSDGMTGLGRGVFSDTSFYEGQWQSGFPHGYGVFSAENGSRFAGQWKEEQLHGLAVYSNRVRGKYYEGEYADGKW
jgi:hypothetical protein